ncbi:hypothetical protein Z517_04873 [Fonsecaea pedrosoi CBS 271.37]|uniref:Uncharacterized protein n=1 Tax=Fonsecaea pedrosoi CBS 271.37 TaxID=1442368 RepID=A0A0D2F564_9EURO|nr:uncharacterized protein Z517_04873 [Fonsecaea pedrosoi CBS 271.37]KIW81847.1 hypothetical protein Z517_04873 [Fonsecaea pedrosoi CBS 271.37]
MAHLTLCHEPYSKFISEDPVTSRYNARLSKADRLMLGPKLRLLQETGSTRTEMLLEVQALIGRPVTLAQLDGLLKEHDICFYKKRDFTSAPEVPDSDATSASTAPPPQHSSTTLMCNLSCPDIWGSESGLEESHGLRCLKITFRPSNCSLLHSEDISTADRKQEHCDCTDVPGQYAIDNIQIQPESMNPDTEGMECGRQSLSARCSKGKTSTSMPCMYRLKRIAFDLYSTIIAEHKDETERGAKMNTIATVFSLLGAYTEAFDLYLLVYYHFRENDGTPDAAYPQVVHGAINCAKSAETTLQMQISRAMLGDVRDMLLSRYGRQSMAGTTTWKYLERARSQHVCMRGRDQTIEPLESFEEQAYWAVSALVLSQDHLGKECGVAPDYCMNSWKGSIMDHLCKCDVTRRCLNTALDKVYSYIHGNQDQIDRHLPWASEQLSVTRGYRYAQDLACLVLEQCVVNGTNFSIGPDHTESENHQGFPCDLKGLAVAILPFMLWTEIFVKALETLWWPSTPLPSFLFHQAIWLMRQKIEKSPAFYKSTIQSVVAQFFPTSDERQVMPCLIPSNTLKRIGRRVAGLLHLPATVVPETEEPWHPLPQKASAWPGFPYLPGSERFLLNSGSLTLAQSCTSSNSSDYRRFWLTASGPRPKSAASTATQQTTPSDQMSFHSSLRFSRVTGLPSNPSLTNSDDVVSLDVSMGG